jgi:hypothetical protein
MQSACSESRGSGLRSLLRDLADSFRIRRRPGSGYLVRYFAATDNPLNAITLNVINLAFLLLGFLLHGTPAR